MDSDGTSVFSNANSHMETGSVSFSVPPHAHVLVLPLLCGILWKNVAGFLVPSHTGPKENPPKPGRFFQK